VSWTPHQAELLQAMGLRLWTPPPPTPLVAARADGAVTAPAPHDTAAPAVRMASAPAPATPSPAVATASMPALAALGWDGLREAVAACRACGLCESRRQTVFGAGHHQAHWMVVGEAPGEQEDQQGEPFVGASGQLLDRMLQALGLTRAADGDAPPAQRVYIANTLKCRPPRNRNPTAAEMAQCEPFLVRQIELLRPRLILAMGRFAVQALLRSDEPLGRLRGRVHDYQGVPLVVTYHPAYLLRQPAEKAGAWADLCLAAQVAEAAPPG
jgi:uracil-DNA glycosylase